MTATRSSGASNRVLGSLTILLILADAAFIVICSIVWRAYRDGSIAAADAAAFTLLGVSAAVSAAILAVAATALFRGARGDRLAQAATGLAGLRLVGLAVAVAVIAVTLGLSAVAGPAGTFAIILAGGEALAVLLATGVALRRTRHAG
jgi:hypothetical protein